MSIFFLYCVCNTAVGRTAEDGTIMREKFPEKNKYFPFQFASICDRIGHERAYALKEKPYMQIRGSQ